MKVLTEEAIAHLRNTFILDANVSAFDVFINSLDDYADRVKSDMDTFVANIDFPDK